MITSHHEPLLALAALAPETPIGMLEGMHYGYGLRYGQYRNNPQGAEEWHQLDEMASDLDDRQLGEILPVLADRAWEAGSHLSVRLAQRLWTKLSVASQGRFLAGAARHLSTSRTEDSPVENKLVDFFLAHLSLVPLEAHAVVEIAINVIRADQPALLDAVLSHTDFDPEASIVRVDEEGCFSEELAQHTHRTLDVLLEAAVRCSRPGMAERLLLLGANPDLPCWNLERSYSQWFSLLGLAFYLLREIDEDGRSEAVIDVLLRHGVDPRGLPCEGLNHPLKMALDCKRWDIADRLLDLGASFTGGIEHKPEDFEKPGRFIPAGHPYFGVMNKDLEWVEKKVAPLMPLLQPWEAPLFYRGGCSGWQQQWLPGKPRK